MKCKEIQINFIDYILNRVSFHQKQLIDYHLQQCAHCNERFYKFKITMKGIESMVLNEPSDKLYDQIKELIKNGN